MFFPLPVTFFLMTYVLVLATQGTIGGVMQVLGSALAPPFARGRFFAIWRPVARLGATVTPSIFAGIAEHAGWHPSLWAQKTIDKRHSTRRRRRGCTRPSADKPSLKLRDRPASGFAPEPA